MTHRMDKAIEEILSLHMKIMRNLKDPSFHRINLTPPQMAILMNIHDHKKCKISTLAKARGVSMPTITDAITRLVRNKYVKREHSQEDRRTVIVNLTKKGKKEVGIFMRLMKRQSKKMTSLLTKSERKIFIKILKKMLKAFSEEKQKK